MKKTRIINYQLSIIKHMKQYDWNREDKRMTTDGYSREMRFGEKL